jgi:peptidyl-tRNA hydrolase
MAKPYRGASENEFVGQRREPGITRGLRSRRLSNKTRHLHNFGRNKARKPETFMNESGRAVGAAAGFFKLEPDVVRVVHDEIDLP